MDVGAHTTKYAIIGQPIFTFRSVIAQYRGEKIGMVSENQVIIGVPEVAYLIIWLEMK